MHSSQFSCQTLWLYVRNMVVPLWYRLFVRTKLGKTAFTKSDAGLIQRTDAMYLKFEQQILLHDTV